MGFVNEKPNQEPAICCRVIIAAFLVLMILLVVLLTCLLEVNQNQTSTTVPKALSNPPSWNSTTPNNLPSSISTIPNNLPSSISTIPNNLPSSISTIPNNPPSSISTTQNNPPSSISTTPTNPPSWTSSTPPNPCPGKRSGLTSFPASSRSDDVILSGGVDYILDRNISVNTIRIREGASLTVIDNGTEIFLETKYILIDSQGALRIGSEDCPHESYLEILLNCLSNDSRSSAVFGRKFIGVAPTGSIDIHGPWKLAWTFIETNIETNTSDFMVNLTDSHNGTWKAGDLVVVASSDYDMEHAEEFELLQCDTCTDMQIKIKGPAKYRHLGVVGTNGVDMKAEIGILTRNIKIHGKMENSCYGDNKCQFFDFDTFGGTTHVLRGTKVARFEGIELYNMGQQPIAARYPIHFHRVFESYGNYAKQLSIHHSFSRCVAIHSAIGLLVEDVVCYDTYGHAFFMPDGNEMYNSLNHNLGLVIKPGTLVPSDRNSTTCIAMTANITVYKPDPDKECNGASIFYIPHPSNYLTNNSAAGSVNYGFFYLFHRESTGPSAGLLPPFYGERSPLGSFVGNRAHSNKKYGFFLDRGVKIDYPSANDPRDFLALIDLERYQPHEGRNLSLPRAPAHLLDFTAYMNSVAMFVRGGDVWISNAMLSDNDVGVIMASSASLPYDQGSHQEVNNSVIVGMSPNNSDWSSRGVPCVGVEIRDGPILIVGNLFANFPADSKRKSYAIGFYPNNTGQSCPANTIKFNEFVDVDTELFFGQVGGQLGSYFGNYSLDGDLTQIVKLVGPVGKLNETSARYAVRLNYPLIQNDNSCVPNDTFSICEKQDFGQLFVNASSKGLLFAIKDVTLQSDALVLQGADRYDSQHPTTTQYQPVLIANHTYRINWINGTAPTSLNLSLHNFEQNSFIQLEICYPPETSFPNASLFLLDQITNMSTQTASVPMTSDYWTLDQAWQEAQYFWNSNTSLLYVKLLVTWMSRRYSYCADDGCHFFNIVANVSYNGSFSCEGPKFNTTVN